MPDPHGDQVPSETSLFRLHGICLLEKLYAAYREHCKYLMLYCSVALCETARVAEQPASPGQLDFVRPASRVRYVADYQLCALTYLMLWRSRYNSDLLWPDVPLLVPLASKYLLLLPGKSVGRAVDCNRVVVPETPGRNL